MVLIFFITLVVFILIAITAFFVYKFKMLLQDIKNQNKMDIANALRDANDYLVKYNNRAVGSLLSPFQENIVNFKQDIDELKKRHNDIHTHQTKQVGELQGQLDNMMKAHGKLTEETNNLTNALKGKVKIQGSFGESILKTLLESSGLKLGKNYLEQPCFISEDGRRKQPDYVIKLPEGRDIIVDSKLSLNSYVDYYNAVREEEREAFLKQMGEAFKKHVDSLASKEYGNIKDLNSANTVLIFIPIESIFILLADRYQHLFLDAGKKNIYVTTSSSLMPLLQVVNNMWRVHHQSKNIEQMARVAGKICDKFAGALDDFDKVRASLKTVDKQLDSIETKFKGKDSFVVNVEKLVKMGASNTKQIPASWKQLEEQNSTDIVISEKGE